VTQLDDRFATEDYYFFNVTNVDAFRTAAEAPRIEEVGPYSVRRLRAKIGGGDGVTNAAGGAIFGPSFNDDAGTVRFSEYQRCEWASTPARRAEEVTTVNVPYVMMMSSLLLPAALATPEELLAAVVGYLRLKKALGKALALGGAGATWTISKDPANNNFCSQIDCGAHGTCRDLGLCECADGYTGVECRDPPDLCAATVCAENGICDGATGLCSCANRFGGQVRLPLVHPLLHTKFY
jgi:hypothetical protein